MLLTILAVTPAAFIRPAFVSCRLAAISEALDYDRFFAALSSCLAVPLAIRAVGCESPSSSAKP
jgi:hypothetical protein